MNLKTKLVTTRKAHTCMSCKCVIPKGSKMTYFVSLYEGNLCSGHICWICVRISDIYEEDIIEENFVKDMLGEGQTPLEFLEEARKTL